MSTSVKVDNLYVQFNDEYTDTSPNLVSGDEIKTIAAKIHKRFGDMGYAAYRDVDTEPEEYSSDLIESGAVYDIEQAVKATESVEFKNLLYLYNTTWVQGNEDYTLTSSISDIPAGSYKFIVSDVSGGKIDSAQFYNSSGTLIGACTPIYTGTISKYDNDFTLTGTATKIVLTNSINTDFNNQTASIIPQDSLDLTYSPYYGSTKSTYDSLKYLTDSGHKNFIDYDKLYPWPLTTTSGITFTNNFDGTVSISGTASSNTTVTLGESLNIVCDTDMMFYGGLTGGSDSTYFIRLSIGNGSTKSDYGNGVIIPKNTTINSISVVVYTGAVITTQNICPTLTPLSNWNTSHETVKHMDDTQDIKDKYLTDVIDHGYKNIIDLHWLPYKQTINGVEWTVDPENGTISATRTSANANNSVLYILYGSNPNQVNLQMDENTVCSGCTGGGDSSYELQVAWKPTSSGTTYLQKQYSDPIMIRKGYIRYIACIVKSGYSANNVVFRPMFLTKRNYNVSTAFKPYCAPADTVYQSVTNHDTALINLIDTGNKNLCKFNRVPGSYGPTDTGGTTFTINADNSVSFNAPSNVTYYAFRVVGDPSTTGWQYGIPIPRGRYILTGLGSNSSTASYRYILGITTSSTTTRQSISIYEDYEFEVTNDTTRIDLSVYVASYNSVSATVYPMICAKSAYNISNKYVPYYASNAELSTAVVPVTKTTITDTSAQALTNCVIAGDVSSVAGKTSGYVVIRTTVLDFNATHVMQVAEFSDGVRKTRLYNGSWQSWV